MAITNIDQLITAMTSGSAQNISWNKTAAPTEGAGTFFDLCQTDGIPGSMATPASTSVGGTTYTGSAAGGLPFNTASSGASTHILAFNATCTIPASLYLIDRLWACSGLAIATGSTSTIVGMPTITRYSSSGSSGVGAEIWYWCITAPSAGGSGYMTVSYTNSEGVSGRTCVINLGGGSPPPTAGQCYVGSLQAGDKGVKSIQSVTNTNTSFTSGSHGLFVAKRLITAPITINSPGTSFDGLRTGLQIIEPQACLNFISLCSSSTSGYWAGNIILVQG